MHAGEDGGAPCVQGENPARTRTVDTVLGKREATQATLQATPLRKCPRQAHPQRQRAGEQLRGLGHSSNPAGTDFLGRGEHCVQQQTHDPGDSRIQRTPQLHASTARRLMVRESSLN